MLRKYLVELGSSPSEDEIMRCAGDINKHLENVYDDAREDLEDVISTDLKDLDESIKRTFKKVYDYVLSQPHLYNVNHFELIDDHFKRALTDQYDEVDIKALDTIDLRSGTGIEEVKLVNATFSKETADKIRKTFNELARIWEDYEANLGLEIEKRKMVLVKNDPEAKASLEKQLTDFEKQQGSFIKIFNWSKWNSENRAKETIAREFMENIWMHPTSHSKIAQDEELKTLSAKRNKVHQLRGNLDTSLVGQGDTQYELNAILKTEEDLDLPETKTILGTHRTNSWVRTAYNIISVLLAGIAAAIRAGASYHKYGTARFYLPKSEKLSMQSKDLIKKTKKIVPEELKGKFGKQK